MDPLLLCLTKFSSVQLIAWVRMTITYIFDDFFVGAPRLTPSHISKKNMRNV